MTVIECTPMYLRVARREEPCRPERKQVDLVSADQSGFISLAALPFEARTPLLPDMFESEAASSRCMLRWQRIGEERLRRPQSSAQAPSSGLTNAAHLESHDAIARGW